MASGKHARPARPSPSTACSRTGPSGRSSPLPAWERFVRRHAGRRFRGIGEPVWAERSASELVECQKHESLLNVAFGGDTPWWLVCPYDTATLGGDAIDAARTSHPHVSRPGWRRERTRYRRPAAAELLQGDLPAPPATAEVVTFHAGPLGAVRDLVAARAAAFGLDRRPALRSRAGPLVARRHGGAAPRRPPLTGGRRD